MVINFLVNDIQFFLLLWKKHEKVMDADARKLLQMIKWRSGVKETHI